MVEVTDSSKDTILQQSDDKYVRKKFYSTGNKVNWILGFNRKVKPGARNPYWKGRLSMVDLLVLISSDQHLFDNANITFYKTSQLNGEVIRIEPSPLVSVPCKNKYYKIV